MKLMARTRVSRSALQRRTHLATQGRGAEDQVRLGAHAKQANTPGSLGALQRTVGNRAATNYILRHPSHADEEEVQRSADGLIQRESKAKRKARMEKAYGVKLTGELPDSMLKKIDEVLKLLPRSHTKGNDALKEITGGGGIGGNASAYDSDAERLEINTPEMPVGGKMPTWIYLLLSKGVKWQRDMMDAGAMSDFNIDAAADTALGLDNKGKRQVMAGASDVLARGNLVTWTLRHETGHSVDQQVKFTNTRAKLPQFGGWRTYDEGSADQMKELATAFLRKAGFSDGQMDMMTKDSPKKSIREVLIGRLQQGEAGISPAWHTALATAMGMTKADAAPLFEALEKTMKIAMAHPWTFSDGGGDLVKVDDRMYHRDHYGTWVSYLAAGRATALSNYQFSSPGEWFAESYAAMYDSDKASAARGRLADPVKQWFVANLGPPASKEKDAEKSTGGLEGKDGKLQTLKDLDDAVLAALSDPLKMATVKLSDLPSDLQSDAGRLPGF